MDIAITQRINTHAHVQFKPVLSKGAVVYSLEWSV